MREGVTLALLLVSSLVMGIVPLTSVISVQDGIPIIPETDTLILDPQQEEEILEKADTLLKSQFQENLGQVGNDEVLFYGRIPGGMVGFGISKVLIWLEGAPTNVVFSFVGAAEVVPKMSDVSAQKSNYFLGDRGTYTNVMSFQKVVYTELWHGIDLIYKATPEGVKYEYHISPGANPEEIEFCIQGHDKITVSRRSLEIESSGFSFIDDGLVAFQDGYSINAEFAEIALNTIGFTIDDYNKELPLIIDPLIFSTYLGGGNIDNGQDVCLDSDNNIYVVGFTESTDFPLMDAYDNTRGSMDCFVSKFDQSGQLLYSTFFGGGSTEYGYSIEVDSDYNVYVSGMTYSTDFPAVKSLQEYHGGSFDCFVFELNSTGNGLLFSTFLGGSSEDCGRHIALDNEGNIYVTGWSYSTNFPTTNAYDSTLSGGRDVIVFKIDPNAGSLEFSTFIGGSGSDYGMFIEIGPNDDIYVTGSTQSSDFPTESAYDSSYNSNDDCYIFRMANNGSTLIFSTYIGGSVVDCGRGIYVEESGDVIIAGYTNSANFPAVNGNDTSHNGNYDAFTLKLSTDGTSLVFSTFIGGTGEDSAHGIDVDGFGNIYVTGHTYSGDFPTVNAFNDTNQGGDEGFVYKLNASGNELLYSTYFGGSGNDRTYGIAVTEMGNVSITGYTYSVDFPTANAIDSGRSGSYDAFVLSLPSYDDSDSDGLSDVFEVRIGTSPLNNDTDADGIPDGWEFIHGLNATFDDSASNFDTDSLTNLNEYYHDTDPFDSDSDDDLLSDDVEVNTWNTDPNDDDSDGDSLSDYEEVILHNTDPLKRDTEDDGMHDDYEVFCSLDPLVDDSGDDYDGDELINIEEFLLGTWANVVDSDSDGLPDGYEVNTRGTDPLDASSPGNYVEYDWCEIIGGNYGDFGYSIKVDNHGYIYVGGTTYSSTFPVLNAFQSVLMGSEDFFVYKLDSTGTTIIFSTYIGGSNSDSLHDIDIDSSGNIYGIGASTSTDFPTRNAFSDTYGGSNDCIVFKLTNTGDELDYSTYIGHSEWETGEAIVVDESGCAIVTGITVSPNFPTEGAYDSVWNGGGDCFILGVNPTGDSLVFSTFFGGSENDYGSDVTLDEQGDVYILGYTDSTDFPTKNAIQNSHAGSYDSFIAKFRMPGNQLIFSTYFGGSIRDVGKGITVDSIGNVIFVGETNSYDFPTSNSFDNQTHGEEDCFVTKLDSSGSSIIFSTYFAGSYDDIASSVVVDVADNVYVAGYTESYDFPTLNAYRDNRFRYYDCFLFKLNSTGQGLFYSTYFSGSEYEYCRDMTIDSSGHIYLTGQTNTYAFPVTGSTYGYTGAGSESFVLKIRPAGDEDGDGLPNEMEVEAGTDALSNDTDSDGMPDYWEVHNGLNATLDDANADLDQDGLINILEYEMQTLPNNNDTDSDLMPDGWEVTHDLNPKGDDSNNDIDLDNLVNYLEYSFGTEPRSNDTDSDMIPDGWEYWNGLNGTVNDAGEDPDVDGLTNLGEYQSNTDPFNDDSDSDGINDGTEVNTYGTNPNLSDSDFDSLSDFDEIENYGTDPLNRDSDFDELSDSEEIITYGTDPLNPDSDGDGMLDGAEVAAGTDPLVPDANVDEDGDGLSNIDEINIGTDPFNIDSDGDGLSDGYEYSMGLDPLAYTVEALTPTLIAAGIVGACVGVGALVFVYNERSFRKARKLRFKRPETMDTILGDEEEGGHE
ncbi:MAG: SBBP repeat-containing protein [Candidatus Thorarchaeota archaeon]